MVTGGVVNVVQLAADIRLARFESRYEPKVDMRTVDDDEASARHEVF